MMKICKKLLALMLSLVMLAGTSVSLCASAVEKNDMYPSIVIPGLFQCEALLYEDGELATNSDGELLEGPFFLDSTMDIVKLALEKAGLPLATTLLTQRDYDDKFANALGEALGEIVLEKVRSDETGKFVHDVRPITYETCVANLSEKDKEAIYDTIPLTTYKEIAGEDKLYFFSYFSFENMDTVTERLYALIQTVKEETGYDKVNIVPISQGGSICNSLLETYRDDEAETDIFDELNRIIYVIPALDGSYTIGDIFYYGLLDDDDALYDYMFPLLLDDEDTQWLGYLVDSLIKIFPKDVLNDVLDIAVDILMRDYMRYSTLMWGLIPSAYYPELRERYMTGDDMAYLREQTDRFYQAQLNRYDNILAAVDNGVLVFDIVNYNVNLYPICDNWNKCQADGIIQLESTSMGAYGLSVDEHLPEGYVQQNTNCTCSDPEHHVHIDPYNLIDASTGLLPDTTFYFYNGQHERTGSCDQVMKLVVKLLTDSTFTSVYSYPEQFPQFNTFRNSKGKINTINRMHNYLGREDIPEDLYNRFVKTLARGDELAADTNCTPEEVQELYDVEEALEEMEYEIVYGSAREETFKEKLEAWFLQILTKFFKAFHELQYSIEGARGFTDLPNFGK